MCYVMAEKQKEQRENKRRKQQTKRGFQHNQPNYSVTQRFGQRANPLHQNRPVFGEFGTITQPVIQRQEYPKTELFHNLFNEIKSAWFCIFDRKQLTKLLEKILGTEIQADAESGETEIKIRDIYYQDEQKKEEFFEYVRQIMDTCRAYKELLYIKYPPNQYMITGDTIVLRADPNVKLSFVTFVQQNTSPNFNPSICREYEEFIVDFIRLKGDVYDTFYKPDYTPPYTQSNYTLNGASMINPVAQDTNYCVYRTMPKQQINNLEKYFAVKDQIEEMIRDAGVQISDIVFGMALGRSQRTQKVEDLGGQIRSLISQTPVVGHLGNLTQALTYGGVLVKFYIKRGEAHNLTGPYLAKGGEVSSGSEGKILQNKIGAKRESRGGDTFSYNLGSNFWTAILFLSTVERYEVFDLRKKEDGRTRDSDLKFNMAPYRNPGV